MQTSGAPGPQQQALSGGWLQPGGPVAAQGAQAAAPAQQASDAQQQPQQYHQHQQQHQQQGQQQPAEEAPDMAMMEAVVNALPGSGEKLMPAQGLLSAPTPACSALLQHQMFTLL